MQMEVHIGYLAGTFRRHLCTILRLKSKRWSSLAVVMSNGANHSRTKGKVSRHRILDRYHKLIKESSKSLESALMSIAVPSSKTHSFDGQRLFEVSWMTGNLSRESEQYYMRKRTKFLLTDISWANGPHYCHQNAYMTSV